MSNLPVDLNDRRVVISVLVVLLAIMTLNWRVFQPLRAKSVHTDVAVDESVYLPADLAEMTGVAAARLGGAAGGMDGLGMVGQAGMSNGARDPFRKSTDPAPAPVRSRSTGRSTGKRSVRLTCAAVLLGGREPTALINGESYHAGDRISGYRVQKIDITGAVLTKADRRLFLPVGGSESDAVHYPPVRDAGSANETEGRTKP